MDVISAISLKENYYTKNKVNFFFTNKYIKNILLKNQHHQEPLQQHIQLHLHRNQSQHLQVSEYIIEKVQ